MSVQLDVITYEIELDIDSSGVATVNIVDGFTIYENGTKIANVRALDFRDGDNTTVRLVQDGARVRVFIDSPDAVASLSNGLTLSGTVGKLGGVLTENTTIEGAATYSLTLGHLTDAAKQLSALYGITIAGGEIYWAVKNPSTGGETSLYLKGSGGSRAILASENGMVFYTTAGGIGSTAATTQQLIAGTTLTLGASVGNFTMTTVGGNIFSLTNPSAVTWARINADNTVTALSANLTMNAILPSKTGNSLKVLRVNAGETDYELATVASGASWGSITGTLSAQTDLQTALDGKWNITGTTTMTGTVTTAFGSNPWLITSSVTTGTGATSGIQGVFDSLTTGHGMEFSTASLSTGNLIHFFSTSTAIDHTLGSGSVLMVTTSGANSASGKTAIAVSGVSTNSGTSSTNIGGYFSASGATTNYSITAIGQVTFTAPTSGIALSISNAGNSAAIGIVAAHSGANGDYPGIRIQNMNSGTIARSIVELRNNNNEQGILFINSTGFTGAASVVGLYSSVGHLQLKPFTAKGVLISSTNGVPTALLHIAAGSATASTAPLKLTTGTVLTTAEAGAMEYNNTFHLTNSDATRRHIVLAPNTTKVIAGAPYANDGYVVVNIGGTDFKMMTTA